MAVRGDVETLYRQRALAVYKYLLCLTHDQALAEDLTADTFERALSGFERFRGDCTPTAWLCAIAKRLWLADRREDWARLGLWGARLVFTTEAPAECARVAECYLHGGEPPARFTRGLYYRGVE